MNPFIEGMRTAESDARQRRLDNFNLFNTYVNFARTNGLAVEPERLHNLATSISGGRNLTNRQQPTAPMASALAQSLEREANAVRERQRERAAESQLAERAAIMQTLSPLLMNNPSDQVLPQISRQFGEDFANDVGQRFDLPSLRQDAIDQRVRDISTTDFFRNLRPGDIAGYYSGEPDEVRRGLSLMSQRIEAERQAAAARGAAARRRDQFATIADNPIIREHLMNDDLDTAASLADSLYGVDRSTFDEMAPTLRTWTDTNYAISAPPAPSADVTNLFTQGDVTGAFHLFQDQNPGTHPNLPQTEQQFEQFMRGPAATTRAGQIGEVRGQATETFEGISEQNRAAAVDAGVATVTANSSASQLEEQQATARRAMLMILGDTSNVTDANYYVDPQQQEAFAQAISDAAGRGLTAAEIADQVPRDLNLPTVGNIRDEYVAAQMAESGLLPGGIGSQRQANAVVDNGAKDHQTFLQTTIEDDPQIQQWNSDQDAVNTIANYRAQERELGTVFARRAEMLRDYAVANPQVADQYLVRAAELERQGAEIQAHIANLIERLQERRESAFARPPSTGGSPGGTGQPLTRQEARHGRTGGSLQYVPAPGTEHLTQEERAQAARQGQLLGSWQWVSAP